MKKLLLTTAALGLLVSSSFAQGMINFGNGSGAANQITVLSNSVGAVAVRTPTNSVFLNYGLFWGHAGAVSNDLAWVSTVGNAVAGPTGVGNGVAGNVRGNTALLIPGTVTAEAGVVVQVRAWSASFGNNWQAAFNAYNSNDETAWWGASRLGTVTLGPTAGPAAGLFGTAPLLAGFTVVQAVPEPSTIALGLMGIGATLVLIRRRK